MLEEISEENIKNEPNKKLANHFVNLIQRTKIGMNNLINEDEKILKDEDRWKNCPTRPGNSLEVCNKLRDDLISSIDINKLKIKRFVSLDIYDFLSKRFFDDINFYLWQILLQTKLMNEKENDLMGYEIQILHTKLAHEQISGRKNFLVYLNKKLINRFQQTREVINDFSSKDNKNYLNQKKEYLKDAADVFFESNDNLSGLATLEILKQDDYLKFYKRARSKKNLELRISLLDEEKEFDLKVQSLANSLIALNSEYNKFRLNNEKNNAEIIKQDIREKLKIAKEDYYDFIIADFMEGKASKKQKIKPVFTVNDKNQATLYIAYNNPEGNSTKPGGIQTYLYTMERVEGNFFPIDKKDYVGLINQVAIDIQEIKTIDQKSIDFLSNILKPTFDNLKKKNIQKIKIIYADSFFLNVPIDILKHGDDLVSNHFSIEYYNFSEYDDSFKNNTKDVLYLFGATKGGANFDPLPGVKKEIELISEAKFSKKIRNKQIFLDEDFNFENLESSFKNNSAYIHIASHYKFDAANKSDAKLLLGNGEVLSLDLIDSKLPESSNNLVVLSACKTANIIDQNEDNIYEGLASVFQNKGSKNVLATLWEVDDNATSSFMYIFYSLIANNDLENTEALRYTKNIFSNGNFKKIPKHLNLGNIKNNSFIGKNLGNFTHPYYWSGFQIYTSEK